MTETNDLFEEIKCKLSRMIGNYGIIRKEIFHDEIFKDIEAYGKAEFERGYKTACTEKRFESDTNFYDLRDENKTLKDQNKELIRENVELKKKVDEKEYFDYINDVHNRAMKNSLDELKQAVEDGCSQYEKMFKKKFGCHPFDYRFPCVSADEIFEAKEPKWYDAEKCLPLPRKAVIIKWSGLEQNGECQGVYTPDNAIQWCLALNMLVPNNFTIEYIMKNITVEKWRYADE